MITVLVAKKKKKMIFTAIHTSQSILEYLLIETGRTRKGKTDRSKKKKKNKNLGT